MLFVMTTYGRRIGASMVVVWMKRTCGVPLPSMVGWVGVLVSALCGECRTHGMFFVVVVVAAAAGGGGGSSSLGGSGCIGRWSSPRLFIRKCCVLSLLLQTSLCDFGTVRFRRTCFVIR